MGLKRRNVQGQLGSTATTLLTASANVTIQPTKLILFGEDADTGVKIYLVDNGDSAAATNQFDEVPSIAQGERVDIGFAGVVLYNGDSVQALSATANRVNYHFSYIEITGE